MTQSKAYSSGPCELEDKAKNLVRFLGRNHYDPAPASVENHNKIIQLVFSEFDPYKLVFTQNDFDYFQKKKYRLNDSLQNQACGFMADFLPVIVKKMETFKKDLTMFSASKALIFNNLDTINLSSLRKLPFARDEFERKNRIQVFIKLWALMRAYSDWDKRSDFQKYVTLNSASILSAELANRECDLFDEKEMKPDALSKRFGQELLKSIAGIYDPHTNYFSEAELEGFNKSLSAEANSFGVILSKSEVNQVQIMEIERGSSAGKSNEIEKGDLVLSIKIDGKPIADFKCMDIWDLQNLIFSSSSKILTLGLKKSNGLTKEVSLTKSIVEVTENHVDGCILINPNLKVGYLPIPSFFDSEINDNDGISGTIAKELLSIQKDGINGLILDLRNNGGGSIQEAIQLI
ncbi:MAG TPA: S41 family peptidase, partial [Catalimonadaceae bacterium]|nr:S41 family peptidase [Catalimonadaceae bacterium]